MNPHNTETTAPRSGNHLIVYAHPKPSSFNHAILETAVDTLRNAGDSVEVSDLYGESFSPVLTATEMERDAETPADVLREPRRVAHADSWLFLYPVWWYGRPAVLQGWCDRVLRPGFAFAHDTATGREFGFLGSKQANIVATFGEERTPGLREQALASMPHGTMGFCGIQDVGTLPLFAAPIVPPETRAEMLDDVRRFLQSRRLDLQSRGASCA